MYIVTREGHRLPVDTSTLTEDDYLSFQQSVGLYDDSTILKEIWILELYKSNRFEVPRKDQWELTFVKELRYEHEPTKEEILWAMSANGCTRWDVAYTKKAYELDMDYED
jgi:hypothetical protein